MKKFFKIVLPVILILFLALVVIKKIKKTKENLAKTKAPIQHYFTVKGVKIKKGKIAEKYKFLGKIKPDKRILVSAKITGRVKKIYVNEGDYVKKGDLIAEIDDIPVKLTIESLKNQKKSLEYQINALHAELNSAKADLKYKKANFLRDKALFNAKAISEENFQKTETLYLIAKNRVEKLKATLQSLNENLKSIDKKIKIEKNNLTYLKIYSKLTGKISKKFVNIGSLAVAGKPIVEIETNKNFKIITEIPSEIAKKITDSSFVIAHINNKIEKLKIRKIYPSSPANSLIEIESRIETLPANITTNSFINVDLIIGEKSGLIVPVTGILSLTNGDYVLTEENGKIKKIKIEKELCSENSCIIKGNIKENQIIATGMEDKLRLIYFRQNGKIALEE